MFTIIDSKRLYAAVALCAIVVYFGAMWNRFALDDVPIIALNPLVAHPSGIWRAFTAPYWAPELGGHMYRPLVIAGFTVDALVDGTAWFHAVNLLWHAGAAVAVAALARRWMDAAGALAAGLLFAVHPVHVEAVANVVGRAEVLATLFAVGAVLAYAGDGELAALGDREQAWGRGAAASARGGWVLGAFCRLAGLASRSRPRPDRLRSVARARDA